MKYISASFFSRFSSVGIETPINQSINQSNILRSSWGQGESAWLYRGHRFNESWHWWSEKGSSYSPGASDADYSLPLPETTCACWRAASYGWWPNSAGHSGSEEVNLENNPQSYLVSAMSKGWMAVGESVFNPLALELDLYSLAHHLCKMWIFYELRRVTLGTTRHFVEK